MIPGAAPLKILVVDDEPAIVRFLRTGLGGQGYTVLTAGNGRSAMELLDRDEVDLVTTALASMRSTARPH